MQYLNKKQVILFDIDYTIFNTSHYKQSNRQQFLLYPEVYGTLSSLEKTSILGIFSEGDQEFQKNKLKETKIWHFFNKDDIYIETNKELLIKEISEKYLARPLVVVDDKLPILLILKKHLPNAKMVWIKRGFYAESQKPIAEFDPDAVFDDLAPLVTYINSK